MLRQVPEAGTALSPKTGKVILYTESTLTYTTVPSVKGKTAQEAQAALLGAGLNIRFTGIAQTDEIPTDTTVLTQSLPPGTKTAYGTVVEIRLCHTGDTD